MRILSWLLALATTMGAVQADPLKAVVRMESHGASAVVISSSQGRTYLLSAAHAWAGPARHKAITLDVPAPGGGSAVGRPRLSKLDPVSDLALIEMQAGPLPHVCPVGPRGHWTSRTWSVGYDAMVLPRAGPLTYPVTRLDRGEGRETYTRERPGKGRSGGGLISSDGYLVGIVHGYEDGGRGIYVSLTAIHRFLGSSGSNPAPRIREERRLQPMPYDGYSPGRPVLPPGGGRL